MYIEIRDWLGRLIKVSAEQANKSGTAAYVGNVLYKKVKGIWKEANLPALAKSRYNRRLNGGRK